MIPMEIKSAIENIRYDLDTVDLLLEFNREKETLQFIPIIFEKMTALEKSTKSEGAPLMESFLRKSLGLNLSCQQVVDKIKQWGPGYSKIKSEELETLNYDFLFKELCKLFETQVKLLKKTYQTPAEKKFKQSCWAVVIVSTLFIAGDCLYRVIQLRTAGLRAEYYKGTNFDEKIGTDLNHTINFNSYLEMWKNLPPDQFSIRWTGCLIVPKDGKYVFSFERDNGLRFYLDDRLLIDEWIDNIGTPSTKEIDLSKGPHKVKIEFFENVGGEFLRFYWSEDGKPKKIVPAKYLRPDSGKL